MQNSFFANGFVESNFQGEVLFNEFFLSSCDFFCFATWVILLFCRLSSSLNLNPTRNSKVWAWMRKSAAVRIKCISCLCPRKRYFALRSFHPKIRLLKIHIICGIRYGFPFLAALWISLTCWLSWSSFQAGPNSKYAEISKHILDQKVECFQGQWDWCQFCKKKI